VTTGIRDAGSVQITDGLESGQRVVTTGAFELAKLEPDVLAKTKVQIAPPKEEEEEEPDTP
jgi:multidrug efflux pump subunit AcrA (membrane-fusion protein)